MDASIPIDPRGFILMILGIHGAGSTPATSSPTLLTTTLTEEVHSQGALEALPEALPEPTPKDERDEFQLWPDIEGVLSDNLSFEDLGLDDTRAPPMKSGFNPNNLNPNKCSAPPMETWQILRDKTDGPPDITWIESSYHIDKYDTAGASDLSTDQEVLQLRFEPVVTLMGQPSEDKIQEAIQKLVLPPEPRFLDRVLHLKGTNSLSVIKSNERSAIELLMSKPRFLQADSCMFYPRTDDYPNDESDSTWLTRLTAIRYDLKSVKRFERAAYKTTSQDPKTTFSVPIAGFVVQNSLERATYRFSAEVRTSEERKAQTMDSHIGESTYFKMLLMDTHGRFEVVQAEFVFNCGITKMILRGDYVAEYKRMRATLNARPFFDEQETELCDTLSHLQSN
ncbi:hypothetical protein M231_03334 [Tremella mesenterica]|uniref:Uncharacterized protein n=1 Tax=Tremella mesenterica TaxID=5217 RepID=A0A4Q1BNE8_TREME|nr:hypothetical protein M231_03334 [Tremella mesenterica]